MASQRLNGLRYRGQIVELNTGTFLYGQVEWQRVSEWPDKMRQDSSCPLMLQPTTFKARPPHSSPPQK